jgi:hypothetical protein
MRSRYRHVAFALALASLGGCGDFVESSDLIDMTTVGAGGGEVTYHALTMKLPPGALDAAVTVRVTEVSAAGALAPAYHVEPDGKTFASAVTVSIALDGLTLPPMNELFLADFTHHPPQPLHNRALDAHAISAMTTATGVFGLLQCPGGACPH